MKKFLGILLSVCMLLGLAVIPAAAADGFDWQISVSFDQEAGTATFNYTPPSGTQWVEMFLLTEKPDKEGFWDIWNTYGDSLNDGRVKRGGSDVNSSSRTVGNLDKADLVDYFEFVPGQKYYTYLATPVNGSAWEISKCFEFTYPGEYTQPEREIYVDCDTTNMTANIYFTPFEGVSWAEMGIYTEPKDNGNKDGTIKRLNNVVPSSLWRIGPSSMTDDNGLVDGVQVLDSHFTFTVGTTYYVYMSYYNGTTKEWHDVPGFTFTFEDGHVDGTIFDADQMIMLSDLNKPIIAASAGESQYTEVKFDAYNGNKGDYRDSFDLNVKRAASSLVFDITNYAGESSLGFQGYRWNGGGTDGNFYLTGEAEGCDGIYLVSRDGQAQRAEVIYSMSRYQAVIPAGFDGYLCIPVTRIGNSNSEELKGNFDHSNDEYTLYWEPGVFFQSRTDKTAVISLNGLGALLYKAGENPVEEPDGTAEELEALLARLPESINASNYNDAKAVLDSISALLTANPELGENYGEAYAAALAEYNAVAALIEAMDAALADLFGADMDKKNEEAWKDAITELYALLAEAEEKGVDISGLGEKTDEYADAFKDAYGYAWNTDKPGDNNGDFATLAFALAAAAGSGVIAARRKKNK